MFLPPVGHAIHQIKEEEVETPSQHSSASPSTHNSYNANTVPAPASPVQPLSTSASVVAVVSLGAGVDVDVLKRELETANLKIQTLQSSLQKLESETSTVCHTSNGPCKKKKKIQLLCCCCCCLMYLAGFCSPQYSFTAPLAPSTQTRCQLISTYNDRRALEASAAGGIPHHLHCSSRLDLLPLCLPLFLKDGTSICPLLPPCVFSFFCFRLSRLCLQMF